MIQLEICDCWYNEYYIDWDNKRQCIYGVVRSVCRGTKERDECSCGGDPAKCDFYPEKREKCTFDKKRSDDLKTEYLNTVEMWWTAQENGGYYECVDGDIAYSKETGLIEQYSGATWPLQCWDCEGKAALDTLLGEGKWVRKDVMTIAEAEEKFGIKIKEDK